MLAASAFFDTNVLLYLFSPDVAKADRAEKLLQSGGQISVQVLNEVASVARRRLFMSWREALDITQALRLICAVHPLTVATHDRGLQIAKRYRLSVYDGMIVASALLAGCARLYTEDLQDGQVIDGRLTIANPFAGKNEVKK